jgi:hypothetical protein
VGSGTELTRLRKYRGTCSNRQKEKKNTKDHSRNTKWAQERHLVITIIASVNKVLFLHILSGIEKVVAADRQETGLSAKNV